MKYMVYILMLVILIFNVSAYYKCEQELANVSNFCSDQDTGTYEFINISDSFNFTDNNINTYILLTENVSVKKEIRINYTKPEYYVNNVGGSSIFNVTGNIIDVSEGIPVYDEFGNCSGYFDDKISILIQYYNSTNPSDPNGDQYLNVSCYNGSWVNLYSNYYYLGDDIKLNDHNILWFLDLNYSLQNCGGNQTLNYTVKDINTNTSVIADIEGAFNYTYYLPEFQNNKIVFSSTYSETNFYNSYSFNVTNSYKEVCINPKYINIETNFLISYNYSGTSYSYYSDYINVSNQTKQITLYVDTGTTLVLFNVKDTLGNNIENAEIQIQKYDVGTNSYMTTEVLSTDNAGNAVGNIVLNIVWYRFVISYDGTTYLTDGPTKLIATTKNFRINLFGNDWYDDYSTYQDMTYTFTFTNATRLFRLEYDDPSLTVDSVCLKVVKYNSSGESLVEESCLSDRSGIMLVNIGTNNNNTRYIGTAYTYFSNNLFILDTIEQNYQVDWVAYNQDGGYMGLFVTFILIIVMALITFYSPVAGIITTTIGVVAAVALGFLNMSWPLTMVVIVLAGVAIWRSGK